MIDWNASAELNGMTEDELRARFVRFPQSNKRVVAICDGCRKVRNIKWQDYHDLCNKCAVNTPEAIEANRLRGIERFSDPNEREKVSEMRKCYNRDHLGAMDAIQLGHAKHFSDPVNRKAASDAKKQHNADNPSAYKSAVENMVGGNDIVKHHYIYDHSDLTKNIMLMTRSMHTKLHRLFQKHGILIPHINVEE